MFFEDLEQAEQETVYLPLGTVQLLWGRGEKLDRVIFTVDQAPGPDRWKR